MRGNLNVRPVWPQIQTAIPRNYSQPDYDHPGRIAGRQFKRRFRATTTARNSLNNQRVAQSHRLPQAGDGNVVVKVRLHLIAPRRR
jgi:hypothetical protein